MLLYFWKINYYLFKITDCRIFGVWFEIDLSWCGFFICLSLAKKCLISSKRKINRKLNNHLYFLFSRDSKQIHIITHTNFSFFRQVVQTLHHSVLRYLRELLFLFVCWLKFVRQVLLSSFEFRIHISTLTLTVEETLMEKA